MATTDAQGRYRLTALPAGVYEVTFALDGFQTVKHPGLRLDVGFVASVDATLPLGGLDEAVNVVGASPVVDVRTTGVSTSLDKDALERIPTSRSMWQVLAMVPGLRVTGTPDVGGSAVGTQQGYQTYGTSAGGNSPTIDGVNTREVIGGAGFYYDYGAFQEVQVKAMGNDAEVAVPGTNFAGIIKAGGNTFSGTGFFAWETPRLQSSNLDDNLRAQGVNDGNPLKAYRDANADLGGPIVRDRLWFYGSYRNQQIRQGVIGYMRAPDEPGENRVLLENYTGKITGQLTPKHRFTGFTQYQVKDQPERQGDAFRMRDATWNQLFKPLAGKVEWTWSKSDRTLVNAYAGHWKFDTDLLTNSDAPPQFDTVTLWRAGSSELGPARVGRNRWQYNASVTHFVPSGWLGSHELKAGTELTRELRYTDRSARPGGNDYMLRFQNGVPFQVVLENSPFASRSRMNTQSAFLRDVWQVAERITLNLGLRVERYDVFLPAQNKPAGRFSEAGDFQERDILEWTAVAPRIGLSWALDESKRTAFKATYGRFNYVTEAGVADTFNPNARITTTYRWNDLNGNRDFDEGELGAFVTATGASSAVHNPDLGQPRTHELTATVERQVARDFSARVSYVYKRESNLFQSVNIERPFDAFNILITGRDPGPDGVLGTADDGGTVTYFDYDPAFRGAAFVRNMALNTPGYSNRYHNVEVAAQKRLSNRWQLVTSYLATRRDVWRSGIPQDPNAEAFFPKAQYWDSVFKLSGSYDLPYDTQVAAMLSSQSGEAWAREARFTTGLEQLTQLVLLMEPVGAQRLPTQNLLNLRLEKRQRLARSVAAFQLDIFNATNTNAALSVTARSGGAFGQVGQIVAPRVVRLGVTFTF